MSSFPSTAYSTAQTKWIGKDHIVAPTVAHALQNWELIKGKRVFDIGCGTGHIGRDLLSHGAVEVFGMDSSEEMVTVARSTYGDVEGLQFEHGSIAKKAASGFDVAVAFFVLQFMKDKDELTGAIRNISKSLNNYGVFVAIVPNGVKNFNPKREEGIKFGAAINLSPEMELYDGRRLDVEFFDNGEVVGTSKVTFFLNETYERILKDVGFRKVEFVPPVISEEGLKLYGEEFFHSYLNPPKDIIIKASK